LITQGKLDRLIVDAHNVLCDKNVYFLWSGGDDSTALLKVLIDSEIYRSCVFRVITIPFPQHVYYKDKLASCVDFFDSRGIEYVVLHPTSKIDYAIRYSEACGVCKTARRNEFLDYYSNLKKKGDIIITAHNLSDLMSYYVELVINRLSIGIVSENSERFLEVTNKFIGQYETEIGSSIYRPFLSLSQLEIQDINKEMNYDNGKMNIIEKKCFWSNQRKRLLQEYFIKSNVMSSYDMVTTMLNKSFTFPMIEDFKKLPFETYLV
jgi:tRNA(Ile)-lysidine synthase TilS/MesJ